jgi:hypothetical protein
MWHKERNRVTLTRIPPREFSSAEFEAGINHHNFRNFKLNHNDGQEKEVKLHLRFSDSAGYFIAKVELFQV